jgi:hypothetical protein
MDTPHNKTAYIAYEAAIGALYTVWCIYVALDSKQGYISYCTFQASCKTFGHQYLYYINLFVWEDPGPHIPFPSRPSFVCKLSLHGTTLAF